MTEEKDLDPNHARPLVATSKDLRNRVVSTRIDDSTPLIRRTIPVLRSLSMQGTGGDDGDGAFHEVNKSRTGASTRSENRCIIWSAGYWPRYRSMDHSVEV